MLDWFLGGILTSKIDVTDELMEFMIIKAGEYLMTRGATPSWEEWNLLGGASQEAFKAAMDAIAIKKALDK